MPNDGVEPSMRIEGCRHTVKRMNEWIDQGACPICLTATAGILRSEVAELREATIEECAFAIGELDGGDPERDKALDEAIAVVRALKGKP